MEKTGVYKALAGFQQECPVIHKGTTGYNYTYADLPQIFKKIMPLLKKHGLGFTQLIIGTSLRTILFHIATGETIEAEAQIPQDVKLNKMNDFQVAGSAITYFRRYALSSILGIVTDKDTDASGDQVESEPDPIAQARSKKDVNNACKFLGLNQEDVKDAVQAGGFDEVRVLEYLNQLTDAKKQDN